MTERAKRAGVSSETCCLICLEAVLGKSRKSIKIQDTFGSSPKDAFIRICDLLQVPFLEIQHDWRFIEDGDEEGAISSKMLPFCTLCITGLHSVIKLQKQLADIQKKIDDKLQGIHEQIRESENSAASSFSDMKVFSFRSKALANSYFKRNSSPNTITTATTTDTTSIYKSPVAVSAQNTIASSSSVQSTLPTPTHIISTTASSQMTADFHFNTIQNEPLLIDTNGTTNKETCNQNYVPSSCGEEITDTYDHAGGDYDSGSDGQCDSPDYKIENGEENKEIHTRANNASSTIFGFPSPAKKRERTSKLKKGERGQPEHFSPIITDSLGRMFYEGILLTPLDKGYQCGQCLAKVGKDHSSIAIRKAKIHIKGFHLNAYNCTICSRKFTSNDILNQHVFRVHSDMGSCPVCGKPVKGRHVNLHLTTHMNSAEKQAAIAAGLLKKRDAKERTHQCRVCGKLFDKPSLVRRHELTHVDAKFRKDYHCSYCDKKYTTVQHMNIHISMVHETLNARKKLCKICNQSVFQRDLKKHIIYHQKYQCLVCLKHFSSPDRLAIHGEKCGKPKPGSEDHQFECDICFKRFPNKKFRNAHRRRTHKNHWKSKIPLKSLKYVAVDNPQEEHENLDDLNNEGVQHVEGNVYSYQLYKFERQTESPPHGYKCLTCSQVLEQKDDEDEDALEEKVKDHVKLRHIGSLQCKKCTKRFKFLIEMEAHHRQEHSNVKWKGHHSCDICGENYISRKLIKRHMYSHKSVWDIVEAINCGQRIPPKLKSHIEAEKLVKEMGVEVEMKCVLCGKCDFEKVDDLCGHRREVHPDAPVSRLSFRKKGEVAKKRKRGRKKTTFKEDGSESSDNDDGFYLKRKRRKIKVIADEDEAESEMGAIDYLEGCDVEIKEEVETTSETTSDDSEEEDDLGIDFFSSGEQSDNEQNDKKEKKRLLEIAKSSGGGTVNDTGTRRSLRVRTALRRNVIYAEDDDDESE